MRKTLIILILLLSLVSVFFILSRVFDSDLGWHLRFGQQIIAGHFPYTDSHTYTFFGKLWVNHEWGGDILFWLIYSNFGHLGLVFFIGTGFWLALFLLQKLFQKKLTLTFALINLASVWSLQLIISTRLTTLSALFFVLLIWLLEKIPHKPKIIWLLPLLIWLWSCLHGSWILAFIVINIYFFGNLFIKIFANLIKKIWPWPILDSGWHKKTYYHLLMAESLGALLTLINPYGLKLWTEVISYFTYSYYKQYIIEWVPSYTYPILFSALAITGISMVFVFLGFKNKKITFPQFLLFWAMFYAMMSYKRNNLYMVIICAPLLTATVEYACLEIKKVYHKINFTLPKILYFVANLTVLLIIFATLNNISYAKDKFNDFSTLGQSAYPLAAVDYLQKEIGSSRAYIFNEFGWGGYLIWRLPNALIYFDGRGAATWLAPNSEITMLEHYHDLMYKPGGLLEINNSPAQWIILKQYESGFGAPGFTDRLFFSDDDLAKIFSANSSALLPEIASSTKWQKAYEDNKAIVWKRIAK